MHDKLVRLADKLDREGKADLAAAIDDVLMGKSAARPKAPLKSMDEDVKKDLLKFIHRVKENLEDSMSSLEEFFRRLRYFDIGDSVKDLKLDKAFKELSKINECVDTAGKAMYALSYGKHPSKSDLEQLADDFGSSKEGPGGPLDFFKSQNKSDEKPEETDEEMLEREDKEDDEYLSSLRGGPQTELHPDDEEMLKREDEEEDEYLRSLRHKPQTDPDFGGKYQADEMDLDPDPDLSDEDFDLFMENLHGPDDDESESFEDEE